MRPEKLARVSSVVEAVPAESDEPTVRTHGSSPGEVTEPAPALPADVTTVMPEAHAASTQAHGIVRNDVERAIHVRLAEQQRDARQRQEQIDRKSGRDVAQRQVPHVHANDPGQRDREEPDVQTRRAAQYDCERERRESDFPQAHRYSPRPQAATDSSAPARLRRLSATPRSRSRR